MVGWLGLQASGKRRYTWWCHPIAARVSRTLWKGAGKRSDGSEKPISRRALDISSAACSVRQHVGAHVVRRMCDDPKSRQYARPDLKEARRLMRYVGEHRALWRAEHADAPVVLAFRGNGEIDEKFYKTIAMAVYHQGRLPLPSRCRSVVQDLREADWIGMF